MAVNSKDDMPGTRVLLKHLFDLRWCIVVHNLHILTRSQPFQNDLQDAAWFLDRYSGKPLTITPSTSIIRPVSLTKWSKTFLLRCKQKYAVSALLQTTNRKTRALDGSGGTRRSEERRVGKECRNRWL